MYIHNTSSKIQLLNHSNHFSKGVGGWGETWFLRLWGGDIHRVIIVCILANKFQREAGQMPPHPCFYARCSTCWCMWIGPVVYFTYTVFYLLSHFSIIKLILPEVSGWQLDHTLVNYEVLPVLRKKIFEIQQQHRTLNKCNQQQVESSQHSPRNDHMTSHDIINQWYHHNV